MNYKSLYQSKNLNPGTYIVRTIIAFLTKMFEANADFGFTVYTDELSKEDSFRALLITSKYDWETKYRSKRPSILVSRGNVSRGSFGTQGMGKVLSITENGNLTSYTDLISVPIVIECLSENDVEAEVLSAIVQTFLALDVRPLQSFGIQIQQPPVQSPALLVEKANVTFISSVIMTLAMQIQYRSHTLSGPLLEEFKMMVNNSTEIHVK